MQVVQGLKSALMMVMVQISFASVNVLYKIVINDGMNVKVLMLTVLCSRQLPLFHLLFFLKGPYLLLTVLCILIKINKTSITSKLYNFNQFTPSVKFFWVNMMFCKYPPEVLHLCAKCPLNLKIYIFFLSLKVTALSLNCGAY